MSDYADNPKKQLPKKNSATSTIDEDSKKQIFEDMPILPPLAENKRPCFLLVDDNAVFLEEMSADWQRYYPQAFKLHTLNPLEDDLLAWIDHHLADKENRLDAIYLDRSIPGGQSALDYLKALRSREHTRYLPVVVITTSDFDTEKEAYEERENLLKYAQWLMYRKTYYPEFLYAMVTALPSAQDAAQDKLWSDLISAVAIWIDQNFHSEDVNAERDLLNKLLGKLFNQHLGLCLYFLRLVGVEGNSTIQWHGPDPDVKMAHDVKPDTTDTELPLLKKLKEAPVPCVLKYDSLTDREVGKFTGLLKKPFLGVSLRYENKPLGSLTLFRLPGDPVFRDKDKDFLGHLALQLSHFLGWRRRLSKQRRRQQILYDYAKLAAELAAGTIEQSKDFLADELVRILHGELNFSDNHRSKATYRKLDRASGRLLLKENLGVATKREKLTLDNKDSLNASAIRQRQTLLLHSNDRRQRYEITDEIESTLTIPIMCGNRVFGSINLAHFDVDHYSEEDKTFAETLCYLCAATLMRLNQFSFHQRLTGLLSALWHGKPFEQLREHIYQDLQRFTGYGLLLYLVPDKTRDCRWRIEHSVERVIEDDQQRTKILADSSAAEWRGFIEENWQSIFAQSLAVDSPAFLYSEGEYPIQPKLPASGEFMKVYAQAVIPIVCQGEFRSAIVLLFRLDKALSPEQQLLLKDFGLLTGEMLEHLAENSDRLKSAQNEAQLGYLYGQMRHVLNNQLGGITNQLDMLEDDGVDRERLNLIRRTLKRSNEQLNSMRYLVGKTHFTEVDLKDLWQELQKSFSSDACFQAQLDFDRVDVNIWYTDEHILKSILYNLALNAAQVCEREGRPCRIRLSVLQKQGEIILRIADDGPGIHKELAERIFDRDFTTRSEGTGFGLYFCQLQAEKLGRRLSLDTSVLSGAVFLLDLPEPER